MPFNIFTSGRLKGPTTLITKTRFELKSSTRRSNSSIYNYVKLPSLRNNLCGFPHLTELDLPD